LDVKLILSSLIIKTDAAAADYLDTILELKFYLLERRGKDYALKKAGIVFQAEKSGPGGDAVDTGNLPLYPNLRKCIFQDNFYILSELGDAIDLPALNLFRSAKEAPALFRFPGGRSFRS
jgi:hypothetical protein